MMALSPDDRYASYAELIADIDRQLLGRPLIHARVDAGRFALATRRTRRPWRAVLAVACALAIGAAAVLLARPSAPIRLPELGSWFIGGDGNRAVLDLDFAKPPAGRVDPLASVFEFSSDPFSTGPGADGADGPRLVDGKLRWNSDQRAFALRHAFDRVDGIQVYVDEHRGSSDLGIALVHPDGNVLRELLFSLRPGDEQPCPVRALDGNEIVPIAGIVPIPRFQAPFDVLLSFSEGADETYVKLQVRKGRETPHMQHLTVPGRSWSSGVFVMKSASYAPEFEVSVDRIVVSGTLSGRTIEGVPWRD
jgi:hypothetical protein